MTNTILEEFGSSPSTWAVMFLLLAYLVQRLGFWLEAREELIGTVVFLLFILPSFIHPAVQAVGLAWHVIGYDAVEHFQHMFETFFDAFGALLIVLRATGLLFTASLDVQTDDNDEQE